MGWYERIVVRRQFPLIPESLGGRDDVDRYGTRSDSSVSLSFPSECRQFVPKSHVACVSQIKFAPQSPQIYLHRSYASLFERLHHGRPLVRLEEHHASALVKPKLHRVVLDSTGRAREFVSGRMECVLEGESGEIERRKGQSTDRGEGDTHR